MYGLKDYPKMVRGAGLRFRVRELYWQLRYAWQRAWRGYDSCDVFNLGFKFVNKMPVLLREFKEHNVALFVDHSMGIMSFLTKEETDSILDEMIFYFENCNEDNVYKRMYGSNPGEKEYSWEEIKAANEERNRCWKEAMRLFSKWSEQLWY